MSHDLYNAQFANVFHQRRGTPLSALDSRQFLDIVPEYGLPGSPPATAAWDAGPVYETTTGLLIPVITGPKESDVCVLKLVRLERTAVFSLAYTSTEGIQRALQEAYRFGQAINGDEIDVAAHPVYRGLVQILGYEMHRDESGRQQVRLRIGPPVEKLPSDPRFPLAAVMSDLVLHQPSVEDMLRSGETSYLRHVLPRAIAELHNERAQPLPYELAAKYAGIDATEEKFVNNVTVLLRSIDRIRQEPAHAADLSTVWTAALAKDLSNLLVQLFVRDRPKFSKLLTHRIEQGFVKRIHGDLKPEHIFKRSQGITPHSPQHQYFGYIDAIDFNEALMYGDIQLDAYHLINAIQAQYPSHPYAALAQEVKIKHQRLTGQINDYPGYVMNAFYDFQNVAIRTGIKAYFKNEFDDALLFARLLPSRMRHLTEAATYLS